MRSDEQLGFREVFGEERDEEFGEERDEELMRLRLDWMDSREGLGIRVNCIFHA